MDNPNESTEQKYPPLKRHQSLQPLSRDHYAGLVQSQRLLRSADEDPAARQAALAGFLGAWESEISLHFADEERLLEPLMSADDVQRLHTEHATLRSLAAEAARQQQSADPEAAFMQRLGQTLNDHIRWEERELFPAIEQSATPEQLQALIAETEVIEASRPRNALKP